MSRRRSGGHRGSAGGEKPVVQKLPEHARPQRRTGASTPPPPKRRPSPKGARKEAAR